MGKYRKKPVVVDAFQYTGMNTPELSEFMSGAQWSWTPADGVSIATLEGVMTAAPYDWIIKGVKGEFYPCKPDIFEATYEVVDV